MLVAAEETGQDLLQADYSGVPCSDEERMRTLVRLADDGYIDAQVLRGGGGIAAVVPQRVLPKGLREVGMWPSASGLGDRRVRRLAYMRALLELCEGDRLNPVSVDEVARAIAIDDAEATRLTQYLADEGLLTWEMGHQVTITHQGVVETEEAIESPDRPTEHFPALNLTVYGDVVNSQLQAGTVGSVQVASLEGQWISTVQEFAAKLREALDQGHLSADSLSAAEDGLVAIESQLATSTPDRSIIRAGVRSVRPIAENLVASGMWQGLIVLADQILG